MTIRSRAFYLLFFFEQNLLFDTREVVGTSLLCLDQTVKDVNTNQLCSPSPNFPEEILVCP
uniref:Uncharacterized protein n=1 Tax=Arundo donax TaxID=35708 RepID=A0A0A8ZX38_ARUDO